MPPSTPAPAAEDSEYNRITTIPDGALDVGNDTTDVRLVGEDTDRVAGSDASNDTDQCPAPGFDDVMVTQGVASQVSRLTASVLAPPKLPTHVHVDDEEDTFLEALRAGGG